MLPRCTVLASAHRGLRCRSTAAPYPWCLYVLGAPIIAACGAHLPVVSLIWRAKAHWWLSRAEFVQNWLVPPPLRLVAHQNGAWRSQGSLALAQAACLVAELAELRLPQCFAP